MADTLNETKPAGQTAPDPQETETKDSPEVLTVNPEPAPTTTSQDHPIDSAAAQSSDQDSATEDAEKHESEDRGPDVVVVKEANKNPEHASESAYGTGAGPWASAEDRPASNPHPEAARKVRAKVEEVCVINKFDCEVFPCA